MAERTMLTVPKGNLLIRLAQRWALLFLLIEIIAFSFLGNNFFSLKGLQIVLMFGTTIFLLGAGETFVIITGGIDLSVGYVMGLGTVVSAKLVLALTAVGLAALPAILIGAGATLLIGLLPGYINGTLVARLRVPPFIATFAMLSITYGASELLLKGEPATNLPHLANFIGNGYVAYYSSASGLAFFVRPELVRGAQVIEILPNIVVIAFLFVGLFGFVLRSTRFGQHVYAIGGSLDAAERAGINVKGHLTRVYVISAFFASLGGVIYMLQYVTGKADAGSSFLLDSIVAVVIGGASMYGGSGTIGGTVLGCFIISVLETGLRMMGLPTFDKYVAVGIVLIIAVLIDQFFPELIHKEA